MELNGQIFGELVCEYVQSVNIDGLPKVNTSWVRVLESEIKRVHSTASRKFKALLKREFEEVNDLPIDIQDF
jgi:hypothetical protein